MKTILAIDLGKSKSVFCKLDTASLKAEYFTLKTAPQCFHDTFAELDGQNAIVLFEIGAQAGWVADMLRQMGLQFKAANVNDPAWKWTNNPNKSDKKDAHRLAMMYHHGFFPEVYIPEKQVRQKRALVGYRKKLSERCTQIKNNIRAVMTSQAIHLPAGKTCWTQKHTALLQQQAQPCQDIQDPCQLWRGQLHTELQLLAATQEQLAVVEAKLDALNQKNGAVQLVMTAQGVGPRTAEALVAVIDDPHRFKSGRHVCSYIGFTPRRFQSGDTDRSGRISKRGNPLLRAMLIQAAWTAIRFRWARDIYERVCRGSSKRKKTAIVAVARHILVCCWAMLRDNKPWRYRTVVNTA